MPDKFDDAVPRRSTLALDLSEAEFGCGGFEARRLDVVAVKLLPRAEVEGQGWCRNCRRRDAAEPRDGPGSWTDCQPSAAKGRARAGQVVEIPVRADCPL